MPSCFFCNSNLHFSQFCDKYKSNHSRVKVARSKNCCIKCFKPSRVCNPQACRFIRRCYICFSREHHTYVCSKKAYQLFVPTINQNLLPRFFQTFNSVEQFQFAFDPDFVSFSLADIRFLNKPFNQYANVTFPETCKIFYQFHTFSESRSPIFDSLMPKMELVLSSIINLKNLELSSKEFLSILSLKTLELICDNVTVTSEVKFSDMLSITKNIQKLEFTETNITVEESWPEILLKNVRLQKFRLLRLTINYANFDVETFATFVKEKTVQNSRITLFIDMPGDYLEIHKIVTDGFEKRFKKVPKASDESRWICIRFIERTEDMPKFIRPLGTFTLKQN